MNKRQVTLLTVLILSAGAAVYVFKDWFKAEPIQIAYTVRPAPAPRNANPTPQRDAPSGKPGYNVTFGFNQKLTLNSVKVFHLQDALTNKYPYAIWDLVSESNSPPVKSLVYGNRLRGLHPTVKGAQAEPLEAGGSYRIVISSDGRKAEKDFEIPR